MGNFQSSANFFYKNCLGSVVNFHSRCWISNIFHQVRIFRDTFLKNIFVPWCSFFPCVFLPWLSPASWCCCRTVCHHLQHKQHLVLQWTCASTASRLPPVCHHQTWWHSLRLWWHHCAQALTCHQHGWGCRHWWGTVEVNEQGSRNPHIAGMFLMHFCVPHGDKKGDCTTTDAGKDGQT